ncbi:hypothetical protein [Cupriavidus sp. D39]|uniref:hypothetical protein n=1 Tax=Cupriavidus sp. D39 TaxID=2997877 RepID=UPI002270CFB9|nr:hypothetical protein [Cupriavidus sp. D39]MCY0852510.1 hypothetical protein [Cupriavidus sp. D39]
MNTIVASSSRAVQDDFTTGLQTVARIATDSIATPLFVKRNGYHVAAALGKSNGPGCVFVLL